MRILHVITTLDVGGAEMHLLAQVRGQRARGHAVRVAYLKGHGSLAPEFEAAGAEWVGRAGVLSPLALRPHLLWCEVVHSHLLKADLVAALCATACGRRRRLVTSKHNDEQVLLRAPVGLVHKGMARLPARTIVLSDHVGRFFQLHGGVSAAATHRIYYGLDPAPFEQARADRRAAAEARAELGIGADEVLMICVARFAPQKAHDVLLRAFASAARGGGPKLRLLLVGDDPFGDGRSRAERLASELELGRQAVFTGIRRDVPRLLAASDLFVMCSLWEGLGLVFLEAMAASLPVLASAVSAVPEVVLDGRTGRLVPPGAVEPLAIAMLELAADRPGRERMGSEGRSRVREVFGLQRMIDETLAVYAEVLAAADGRVEG